MFSWMSFIMLMVLCLISSIAITLFVPSREIDTPPPRKQNERSSDFPEFDGKDARTVLIDMQAKYPRYQPEIVPEGSAVTMDYNEWRVRIYVKKSGRVIGSYIG